MSDKALNLNKPLSFHIQFVFLSVEYLESIFTLKMSDKAEPEQATPPLPSSPAAKYGKDSEFGQILDFIQGIVSDEALRHEFDIPHLVVVGRQNMAKTTLINRLIGRSVYV